jgi:hypothetical protein
LLICVKNDINVLLVEGSGKTTERTQRCALELNYASISRAQTGKHEFLASLMQMETLLKLNFIRYSKRGGLFLIDELDAGNAGVLTSINSASGKRFVRLRLRDGREARKF